MTRTLATLLVTAAVALPTAASAQSAPDRPLSPRVEITLFPAGALVATEGSGPAQPAFNSFTPAGSILFAITPRIGLEAELGGAVGINQQLDFTGGTLGKTTTPSMVNASGNLVVNLLPGGGRFVPYLTGGAGAITLLQTEALGIHDAQTSFAANLGAGLKTMFGRWGLRGDYRLFLVDPATDSSGFLGADTRYAHRVTGGVVIGLGEVARPRQ